MREFIWAVLVLAVFGNACTLVNVSDSNGTLGLAYDGCVTLVINETSNFTVNAPGLVNDLVQFRAAGFNSTELLSYACHSGETVLNTPRLALNFSLQPGQYNDSLIGSLGLSASCGVAPACECTNETFCPMQGQRWVVNSSLRMRNAECDFEAVAENTSFGTPEVLEKSIRGGAFFSVENKTYKYLNLSCFDLTAGVTVNNSCPVVNTSTEKCEECKHVSPTQIVAVSGCGVGLVPAAGLDVSGSVLGSFCLDSESGDKKCPAGWKGTSGICTLNCPEGTYVSGRVCKDNKGVKSCPKGLTGDPCDVDNTWTAENFEWGLVILGIISVLYAFVKVKVGL